MDFDETKYILGKHVLERWEERIGYNEGKLLLIIQSGEILFESGNHRYIRNGKLFFPCVKIGKNQYKVKTIMVWDMVKHRLKSVLLNSIK